jgi:hypothetical protein
MSASYPFIAHHRTNLDHYNYYYFTNAFTNEEIKALHKVADLFPKQPGLTGATPESGETEYRVSEISWLHETNDTMWIYNKISELAMTANQQMWNLIKVAITIGMVIWALECQIENFLVFFN